MEGCVSVRRKEVNSGLIAASMGVCIQVMAEIYIRDS